MPWCMRCCGACVTPEARARNRAAARANRGVCSERGRLGAAEEQRQQLLLGRRGLGLDDTHGRETHPGWPKRKTEDVEINGYLRFAARRCQRDHDPESDARVRAGRPHGKQGNTGTVEARALERLAGEAPAKQVGEAGSSSCALGIRDVSSREVPARHDHHPGGLFRRLPGLCP
jgi:hypothetical protein